MDVRKDTAYKFEAVECNSAEVATKSVDADGARKKEAVGEDSHVVLRILDNPFWIR